MLQGANWVELAQRTVAFGDDDYTYTFDFTNDADLKELALDAVGAHRFRVLEVIPEQGHGGIVYDTGLRYFDVVCTDATMDGKLEIREVVATEPVTVNAGSGNIAWVVNADFTNTYEATEGDDVLITIDKTVTDKVGAGIGKDGFSFGLYTVGGDTPIVTAEPTDANGKTFISLTFPANTAGREYHFELREIIPENKLEGMTYVTEPYPVTVRVVDNNDGTVTAFVVTEDGLAQDVTVAFENVYAPAAAQVTLSGTKIMEGRDLAADECIFELYEDGSTTPLIAKNTSKADGGTFTFAPLTFDTIGTYRYTIKEQRGALEGVTYSDKVYEVVIAVSDDADNDGVLDVQITIDGTVTATVDITAAVRFTNTYTPVTPEEPPVTPEEPPVTPEEPPVTPEEPPETPEEPPVTPEEPPVTPEPPVIPPSVNTGESTNLNGLLALSFVSGAYLLGVVLCAKKKREAEET